MPFSYLIQKVYAAAPPKITIPINDKTSNPSSLINNLFSNGYGLLLNIGGTVALIMLIWYGIQYLMSGGSPEKAKQAKAGVINTVYGIIIASLAFLIIRVGANLGNTFDALTAK